MFVFILLSFIIYLFRASIHEERLRRIHRQYRDVDQYDDLCFALLRMMRRSNIINYYTFQLKQCDGLARQARYSAQFISHNVHVYLLLTRVGAFNQLNTISKTFSLSVRNDGRLWGCSGAFRNAEKIENLLAHFILVSTRSLSQSSESFPIGIQCPLTSFFLLFLIGTYARVRTSSLSFALERNEHTKPNFIDCCPKTH